MQENSGIILGSNAQADDAGPSKMSNDSSTAPKKKSSQDYYFARVIGEGAFSTVYLARDIRTKQEVAIKMCNKDLIRREKKVKAITREKEILCVLGQKWNEKAPYFVRLFATMQDNSSLYFVLTYAKHGDMFKFIKKMAQKHVDVTQFYAAELVQAVEHLHRLSIIHRDLKPENILLSGDMHILLTDFGSAKIVDEKTDDDRNTEEAPGSKRSSFVGTAQYVSPEILTNKGSFPASDLWAIGCILYQMLSGMPPFQSQSEYLIFQKIQKLEYSFHEGFNQAAKDLVKKFLVIEATGRLGAEDDIDKDGYVSIKNHLFFKGINFENLHNSSPPQIESYLRTNTEEDPVWQRHPNMKPGLDKEAINRILKDQIEGHSDSADEESEEDILDSSSSLEVSLNMAELADQERTRLLEEQQKNNEFHRFVEGKLILKQGLLDKKKGLWSRRRMFLLTEGPRLLYVDTKEMVVKGEIPWSADMKTEMKNFKIFFVHTPNRIYYMIDNTSFASKWCEAIDSVKNFYFPTS